MPTIKPELSGKSKYWIPKHRYYELKHYCLQYPHWQELYNKLSGRIKTHNQSVVASGENLYPESDVEKWAVICADLNRAMELVDRTCKDASLELHNYLFVGVTDGVSFNKMQARYDIPCGSDMYYEAYRKFFYLLSQRRGI